MASRSAPAVEVPDVNAVELCRSVDLRDEPRALLTPDLGVREYVERLLEHGHGPDAAAAIAHWLPKRESVWWACCCIRSVSTDADLAKLRPPLEAAERWVADPSEENRRSAGKAAEAQGFETAAAVAAMGAFWSGGSMSPSGQPDVPPGELFTAKAVSGAVSLAAVLREPEEAPRKHGEFASIAFDIADGNRAWPVVRAAGSEGASSWR